jgi:quercetin dioxygenase-like cupin family protein
VKRIFCSLLVSLLAATLPLGGVATAAPESKNAKVTLVYQHELPNCPGKSIKGVLVEYGPGGYSPAHTHAKSAFIYATVLEGAIRSQVNDGPVTIYKAGESFLRDARRSPSRQRQCQRDQAGQAAGGVRGEYERDGTDDPIGELKFSSFRAEVLRPLCPSRQVGTSGMIQGKRWAPRLCGSGRASDERCSQSSK